MIEIEELSKDLGLKTNTFRYWLKRNEEDFNSGIYDFYLMSLCKKISFTPQNRTTNRKIYYKYVVYDKKLFMNEFDNYIKYIKEAKRKSKLYRSLNWTRSAFECYIANFECNKCFNKHFCKRFLDKNIEPPMKKTVKKLLEKVGRPYFKEDFFYA